MNILAASFYHSPWLLGLRSSAISQLSACLGHCSSLNWGAPGDSGFLDDMILGSQTAL